MSLKQLDSRDWHIFRNGKWEQVGAFVRELVRIEGDAVLLSNTLIEEYVPGKTRHERYVPIPEELIDRTTKRVFSHVLQDSIPIGALNVAD